MSGEVDAGLTSQTKDGVKDVYIVPRSIGYSTIIQVLIGIIVNSCISTGSLQ